MTRVKPKPKVDTKSKAQTEAPTQAKEPRGELGFPSLNSRRLDTIRASLKFDKNQLDEVLERQGKDFMDVAEELAYAVSARDRLKNRVKEEAIEVRSNLRAEAEVSEKKKPSEAALEEESFIHPTVRALREKLEDAELIVGRLTALLEAFRQRSFAVKDIAVTESEARFKPDSVRYREGSRENYRR